MTNVLDGIIDEPGPVSESKINEGKADTSAVTNYKHGIKNRAQEEVVNFNTLDTQLREEVIRFLV